MVMPQRNQILNRSFQILFFIALLFCIIGECEAGQTKLDAVAVEQSLKAWFTKNPFVKMHGIHRGSETSATAYFVIQTNGKEKDTRAHMLYFIDKGWFIIRIEYGHRLNTAGWYDVFEKIERKK